MRTGFVYDPIFLRHDTGPGHPERPERLEAVLQATEGLDLVPLEARDATEEELHTVHAVGYPALIRKRIEAGVRHLDADTAVGSQSYAAALRAAGAALALGEALLEGTVEAGFAAVRPPGHHACCAEAMGFCLFNNIALLARYLHDRGRRVAIVDWDVHHGNGSQDIFWELPEVGFCSLHQYPFFPGTGAEHEKGSGNILNIPLPAGTGGAEYRAAFRSRVIPWLEARAPDVILVSAGFDAHENEHMAHMRLKAEDYAEFTRMLLGRPILAVLEGGYDLDGLTTSIRAHLRVLLES